jgi:hypothetical protein
MFPIRSNTTIQILLAALCGVSVSAPALILGLTQAS